MRSSCRATKGSSSCYYAFLCGGFSLVLSSASKLWLVLTAGKGGQPCHSYCLCLILGFEKCFFSVDIHERHWLERWQMAEDRSRKSRILAQIPSRAEPEARVGGDEIAFGVRVCMCAFGCDV